MSLAEPPACNQAWKVSSRIVRSSAGSSFSRPSTDDLIFAITSGALTAATASGVSSKTVTSESAERLPGDRQPGESQRVAGFGQVVKRRTDADSRGRGLAEHLDKRAEGVAVGSRTWTMPTCKSGSSRHADRMSRTDELVFDRGQSQLSDRRQLGRHDDVRPGGGQPQQVCRLPEALAVGYPPRQQRFDQRRPFFLLLENLRGQLLAVGGCSSPG